MTPGAYMLAILPCSWKFDSAPAVPGNVAGHAFEKKLQIRSHNNVGIQFDTKSRTLPLHQKIVKRFEGKPALGFGTLVNCG